jgi:hypothetical protein
MRNLMVGSVLVCSMTALIPGRLRAEACKTERLQGEYSMLGIGAVDIPGLPITGPFRRVSRPVFDGQGHVLVANSYASYNGLIFNEPFQGAYSVNADCTVSITVAIGAPLFFPVSFSGVLSHDLRELDFTIAGPPGASVIAHLTKQDIGHACTAADLIGAYRFELQGQFVAPIPGDFAQLGLLTADGKGNFTAATNASYNGLIGPENIAGTYSIDANCMATIHYPSPSGPVTLWGGLNDGGRGANLIRIDPPGSAIAGGLLRAGGGRD